MVRRLGIDAFLLCDLDESKTPKFSELVPLRSCSDLRLSLKGKLADKWVNAGAAHLTCFKHSVSSGYTDFWNIDADDTMFFEDPSVLASGMRLVEDHALQLGIDCFSLDMYQTFQFHWSFGMTFVRNSTNYLLLTQNIHADDVVRSYPAINQGNAFVRKEDGLIYRLIGYNGNIDWFFTFMRDKKMINANSFYFENSHFAHVGIFGYDALGQLVNGVYYWRNGKIWGRPIANDCVKFELDHLYDRIPQSQ